MYCSNCGEKIPDDLSFCSSCGHSISNINNYSREKKSSFKNFLNTVTQNSYENNKKILLDQIHECEEEISRDEKKLKKKSGVRKSLLEENIKDNQDELDFLKRRLRDIELKHKHRERLLNIDNNENDGEIDYLKFDDFNIEIEDNEELKEKRQLEEEERQLEEEERQLEEEERQLEEEERQLEEEDEDYFIKISIEPNIPEDPDEEKHTENLENQDIYDENAESVNEETEESTNDEENVNSTTNKCPCCGEYIPTYTAVCPSCGMDVGSSNLTSNINKFKNEIKKCDSIINYSKTANYGYAGWETQIQFIFIVANLFLLGFPFFIYKLWYFIKFDILNKYTFSSEELNKTGLIKSFMVPSSREAIIDGLLYVKSQMNYLASAKYNVKNTYWAGLWNVVAEELYEEADILFPGDSLVKKAKEDIQEDFEIVKQKKKDNNKKSIIIFSIAFVIYLLLFGVFNNTDTNSSKETDAENIKLEQIYSDANNYLNNNDFNNALIEANKLYYQGDDDNLKKKWDKKRNELVESISTKVSANQNTSDQSVQESNEQSPPYQETTYQDTSYYQDTGYVENYDQGVENNVNF